MKLSWNLFLYMTNVFVKLSIVFVLRFFFISASSPLYCKQQLWIHTQLRKTPTLIKGNSSYLEIHYFVFIDFILLRALSDLFKFRSSNECDFFPFSRTTCLCISYFTLLHHEINVITDIILLLDFFA